MEGPVCCLTSACINKCAVLIGTAEFNNWTRPQISVHTGVANIRNTDLSIARDDRVASVGVGPLQCHRAVIRSHYGEAAATIIADDSIKGGSAADRTIDRSR